MSASVVGVPTSWLDDDRLRVIADILLSACPSEGDGGSIDAAVEDGHVRARYWYEHAGELRQPTIGSLGAFRIAQSLSDIRATWPTPPVWSAVILTLFRDGRVTFDARDDPA